MIMNNLKTTNGTVSKLQFLHAMGNHIFIRKDQLALIIV